MKRVENWEELTAQICKQYGGGTPIGIGEVVSIKEFKERYPHYEEGVTTICEPPMKNYIARIDEHTNYWLYISFAKLYSDY